jgi:hypothetical protein
MMSTTGERIRLAIADHPAIADHRTVMESDVDGQTWMSIIPISGHWRTLTRHSCSYRSLMLILRE